MVIASQPVNGLALEILFFLKELDPKEFEGRILSGELKERRSLGWSPIQDAAEGVFAGRNAEDLR